MQTKTRVNNQRVGIRKNLTTYFTVRFLQGTALMITFYLYMNTFGVNEIPFKWMLITFPGCIIFTTYVLEMIHHWGNKE
ncbi:hypothetical protein QK289_15575 [Exiguobacterium antarcticum]|uniref:Uncharacterized protein n=1 Tax=Exiguobacterium antarcticum TaxID=132920 RepID=A0ABT6R652_9BACL|nr:hypothetical protein [Exiguobacterium antarcticum]MDI3236435.1 hypothetical protein [Exiguobacterium antarcticum]